MNTRRVLNPERYSVEQEQLIVSVANQTGFGSLAIAELYDFMVQQRIYSPSNLQSFALSISDANISIHSATRLIATLLKDDRQNFLKALAIKLK